MPRALARLLWRALAVLCIVLAVIGVVLPVLPTVPFLLVAAWAAGNGWPALETWLLNHPRFGPGIRRWRESGAVPRRAKWLATVMMACSAVLLMLTPAPPAVRIAVTAVMAAVAIWLWRRPEV
ncbi:MAG: YbaN family protein [Burkholderiales bacterium]|jgi:uncharacterized membrane protein YbaN (DUF454 family)|nr:YbaN family protein [Burkholderiales bacterium]